MNMHWRNDYTNNLTGFVLIYNVQHLLVQDIKIWGDRNMFMHISTHKIASISYIYNLIETVDKSI